MCHSWSQISCQHQILIKYFLSNIFQNYFATHWRLLSWVNTIWVTDNVHHWSVWASHCLISPRLRAPVVTSSLLHCLTRTEHWAALVDQNQDVHTTTSRANTLQHHSPAFLPIISEWIISSAVTHWLLSLSPVSGEVSQCHENNSLVLSSECWVESLRAMVAGGGWVRNEQVIQHEQSPLVILTLALQDTALHWSFYSDHHWFIAPDHHHTWDSSTDDHHSPSTILSSSADNHQWHNVLQWLIACKDIHCLQIIIKMI